MVSTILGANVSKRHLGTSSQVPLRLVENGNLWADSYDLMTSVRLDHRCSGPHGCTAKGNMDKVVVRENFSWEISKRKFLKSWDYQITLPASWEICMQVKKQQLESDMERSSMERNSMERTWFQIGKAVHQACILSPCLFNLYAEYIMKNARLDEAQARIKTARRNINNLRYADDTTLMAEREEELKSLLMKMKEES